jgi:hypothetical protein
MRAYQHMSPAFAIWVFASVNACIRVREFYKDYIGYDPFEHDVAHFGSLSPSGDFSFQLFMQM